jgi:hypothetical protein
MALAAGSSAAGSSFWRIACVAALALSQPVFAQKLVDPDKVAPEFREAAQKRRAEQLKVIACGLKADHSKIPRRDRADYVTKCVGEEDQTQTLDPAPRKTE